MGDVAVKRIGNQEYRVYGLQELAEEIQGAARQLSDATGTRHDAAQAALADWRGRHADTFVERVNTVLAGMVSLQLAVQAAARRCRAFPGEAAGNPSIVDQYSYQGARVHFADAGSATSSAEPAALRGYAEAAADQAGRFGSAAGRVTTEGLTAEVTELRALDADERAEQREAGTPQYEIDTMQVWGDRQPVPVEEVFGLPDLTGEASRLQADSDDLTDWVAAVAFAFENADSDLLELLLDHPEIAGYFADGILADGTMTGEAALALVLANLGLFDTAGGRGGADQVVGLSDLEAIANDPSAPAHLRDAARYLLDNRLLLSLASIVDGTEPYEIRPDDARLTPEGIRLFLEFNQSLNAVALDFDRLDVAAHGGDPDGYVSVNDLRAAADDPSLPRELRDAAAFLLANGRLSQRIALYEQANANRMVGSGHPSYPMTTDPSGFSRNGVIALAIDQQAFPDPVDARRFVESLPVADGHGNGGLPITLTSDEGVRALANTALLDAPDLTDQHSVIAHLPETTGWNGSRGAVEQAGGVRNTLINGFYEMMAGRSEELFAGDLAGHPEVAGHPGANWLLFAPWASNGVHGVITGDTTGPLGFTTSGIMQAAADGNQFLFNDIGGRYAAFIELYENNPHPSEVELERFFSATFNDGDGTIRDGFAAYVAAMEEDDPVHRQRLMFQGNTLIATHEQAGVQPYLERVSFGPDGIATNFVELQVGSERLSVKDDVPQWTGANNHIIPATLLSLDTGPLTAESYVGDRTRFAVGGERTDGVVDLADIRGIEAFQPDYSTSTRDWWENGTGDDRQPDSLRGSGASSWPDWNERMNYILHLFEQNHTNPELYNTDRIAVGFENVEWLSPDARPGR